MYGDLKKKFWMNYLGLERLSSLPYGTIIEGSRDYLRAVKRRKVFFDKVLDTSLPGVFIGIINNIPIIYGCVYGQVLTFEIAYISGLLKIPRIIQIGSCGAIHKDYLPATYLIVSDAYIGDGTFSYASKNIKTISSDPALLNRLEKLCISQKNPYKIGTVYSIFDILLETQEKINLLMKKKWNVIDMETAVTFSVAEHFGMKKAGILFIHDNLAIGRSTLEKLSHNEKRRLKILRNSMLELAVKSILKT